MRQRGLFRDVEKSLALPCIRVQMRARRALGRYAAGAARPSFALRTLAEEQARLELLRAALRTAARLTGSVQATPAASPAGGPRKLKHAPPRGSRLRLVEYVSSSAGARAQREVAACVRRIEELEAKLLCA